MDIDEIEREERGLRERIPRYCNGAPRARVDILAAMAGADSQRLELPEADAARVHRATVALEALVREGLMVRERPGEGADPALDLYRPTSR